MSTFNYNVTAKVKRLPFVDKTNFIHRDDSTSIVLNCRLPKKRIFKSFASIDPKFKLIASCIIHKELSSTSDHLQSQNVAIEQIISEDPKFTLIPKVHLQCCSIINREHSSTSAHRESRKVGIEQIISQDPKFTLISKVHLQRCSIIIKEHSSTPAHLESQNVAIEQIVTNDPKFTLMPKVHLQRLNMKENMPNLPSTKFVRDNVSGKNVIVRKISTNSNNNPKEVSRYFKYGNCKFVPNGGNEIIKTIKYVREEGKALRKRGIKNYAELSFKESPEKNLERSYREHVPVYLQSTTIAQKQRERDPFEFLSDSFSDAKKKKPRGRPRKEIPSPLKRMGRAEEPSDSDSSLYDKSMHEILKEIRQKVNPKKRKYIKRVNVKQNNKVKVVTNQVKKGQLQIAPANINKNGLVVSNVKVRPNNRQKQVVTVSTKQNFNEISNRNANVFVSSGPNNIRPLKDVVNPSTLILPTQEMQNISRSVSRVAGQNIPQETNDCDRYFGFDEDYEDDNISGILPAKRDPNGMTTLSSIKPITITQRFTSLTSTPLPNIQRCSPKIKTNNQVNPKRINIISDVLVSPSRRTKLPKEPRALEIAMPTVVETLTVDTSCAAFEVEDNCDFLGFDNSHLGPGHSLGSEASTHTFTDSVTHQTKFTKNGFRGLDNVNVMIRQTLNRTSRPWRGDRLHVRRNPHFLTMKDTSLPCYNQEMILGPKLLEIPETLKHKVEDRSNKVQTSILDFVSSNRINESTPTKKNNHNMSLFDDDDFSPIRNKNSPENSCPTKDEKLKTPKGKRNIFWVSRKKNETSPLRQRNREEEFGIENYFGFDSPDSRRGMIGKENVRVTRKRAKRENNINEEALPMRVHMKQVTKVREELVDEINFEKHRAEEPTVQEIANESPKEKSQDDNVPHVGLFEDLAEVRPPPRIYGGKRMKRTRAESVSTDIVEEEKPKRKRKDMPTPAEEEEFNNWAATFNAMCDEVDKHSLETV